MLWRSNVWQVSSAFCDHVWARPDTSCTYGQATKKKDLPRRAAHSLIQGDHENGGLKVYCNRLFTVNICSIFEYRWPILNIYIKLVSIIEIVDLCRDHEPFSSFFFLVRFPHHVPRLEFCTLIPHGFVGFRHSFTATQSNYPNWLDESLTGPSSHP